MKLSNKSQVKKAVRKLFKELNAVESCISSTIAINNMISLQGSYWRHNGIKTYEIQGYIDTKPFAKKAGWACFFSASVESKKRLHKKIINSLHEFLEVDYGL